MNFLNLKKSHLIFKNDEDSPSLCEYNFCDCRHFEQYLGGIIGQG